MTTTPVLLILYNRPDTTAQVIEALRAVQPSRLYIAADAPANADQVARCEAARQVTERIDWPCTITRWYADAHMGLKRRVESAFDAVFEQEERAIIVEDDCLPDPSFFAYCHELLIRYADDPRVTTISGANFHFGEYTTPSSYHFSRYPLIWGWATWRRAWRLHDPLMRAFPDVSQTRWLIDLLGTAPAAHYWRDLFAEAYRTHHTWDYPWTFSSWQHHGLSVIPKHNLVRNLGFRADASHTHDPTSRLANMAVQPLQFPLVHPASVERDAAADEVTERIAYSGTSIAAMLAAARAHIHSQHDA